MSSLVGRESELVAVETFLRSGRPRAVAIVGEAGIGKTTLWQAAVELAHAQGARVGACPSADPRARARPPDRAPRAGTAYGRRPPPRADAGARAHVSATDARADRAGGRREPALRDRDRARARPPRRARHLGPRSRPAEPRPARPGTRPGPSGRRDRRAAARR